VWQDEEEGEEQEADWEGVVLHYHALGEELRRAYDEWVQGQTLLFTILSSNSSQEEQLDISSSRSGGTIYEASDALDHEDDAVPTLAVPPRLESLLEEQVFEAETPQLQEDKEETMAAAATGTKGGSGQSKREQRIAEKRQQEEEKRKRQREEKHDKAESIHEEDERMQLVTELKSVLAQADQRRQRSRRRPPPEAENLMT